MKTQPKSNAENVHAGLEPLLTPTDLKQLLRVSRRTISRLIQRGALPAPMIVGGTHRWRTSDIEKALEALGKQSAQPQKHARSEDRE